MFDIVTVGHFSLDLIRQPRSYVTTKVLGGPPTYVSLAARKMGAKVSVISKVGEDFPQRRIRWLRNRAVDLSGLKKVEGASTTGFVLDYRRDRERMLILKSRAPPIESEDIPTSLKAKAVHIAPIANEIPREALQKLLNLTSLISLDPQGFLRRFRGDGETYLSGMENPQILRKVDVFKASQKEIEALTGEADLVRAIRRIAKLGTKIVIVTRGTEGAFLAFEGNLHQVPAAKPRAVVDTTGAGDVFAGAFLADYVQGRDTLWCACVGSAAASFAVESFGPRGFGSKKRVYERATLVYEKVSISARV